MTRLKKRATVHLDGHLIRKVPVYTVEGRDRLRDIVVSRHRVPEDVANRIPNSVDVNWAGYEYVAEFQDMTDDGDLVYSFELETDEQRRPH